MSNRLQTHFYHLLLTNYCNQKCPFCYAGKLMATPKNTREMSLENLTLILNKFGRATGLKQVKVLGGEPTLHSRFDEAMRILFDHVDQAGLFTNGVFSDAVNTVIKQYVPRLKLTFNIMTPGFRFNKKTRAQVRERIRELSRLTSVSLSVIVEPRTRVADILETVDAADLENVHSIRIGVANPVMGGQNSYAFHEFPLVGNKVMEAIEGLKKLNGKLRFQMDCGFTRCMFSEAQYEKLKLNKVDHMLGCFQGEMIGCLDVQTDLKAIPCYALSETKKADFLKQGVTRVENGLFLKQLDYHRSYVMEKCRTCQWAKGNNRCTGPCLAFRINALSQKK